MSRRTKSPVRTPAFLNRVIGLAFALFVLVGAFGVTTVYLRHEAALLANQNKALYRGITEEKRKIAELGATITRRTTREALKRMNNEYALGLRLPTERQIVRVLEDPSKRLYEKGSRSVLTVSRF